MLNTIVDFVLFDLYITSSDMVFHKPHFEKSCKKCQYYDKELQYFRGSIGYANLSQEFAEKVILTSLAGCSY